MFAVRTDYVQPQRFATWEEAELFAIEHAHPHDYLSDPPWEVVTLDQATGDWVTAPAPKPQPMTVAGLIAILAKYPPTATVLVNHGRSDLANGRPVAWVEPLPENPSDWDGDPVTRVNIVGCGDE